MRLLAQKTFLGGMKVKVGSVKTVGVEDEKTLNISNHLALFLFPVRRIYRSLYGLSNGFFTDRFPVQPLRGALMTKSTLLPLPFAKTFYAVNI